LAKGWPVAGMMMVSLLLRGQRGGGGSARKDDLELERKWKERERRR